MPLYVKHTAYSFLLCVFMGILCPKLLCHSNSHSIYLYLIHLSGLFQHLARQSYHIIIFWRLYNIFLIYFFVDFRIQSAFPFVSKFQWPFHLFFFFLRQFPDAGKDWGQEEKGMTEDEMIGWHHWLNGHGFGWTPGIGDGRGGLVCWDSWGHKESDTTEQLNWTEGSSREQ